jgi:hypothetical protein
VLIDGDVACVIHHHLKLDNAGKPQQKYDKYDNVLYV